jgi:hypothetical protein
MTGGGNNDADALGERILLIPSTHASVKKQSAWHQRPYAGCVVLALFSLFGLACVSLPSFESPGNITVFRVSEADVKVGVGTSHDVTTRRQNTQLLTVSVVHVSNLTPG